MDKAAAQRASTTNPFQNLLSQVSSDYPRFSFQPGKLFSWSPADKRITYKQTANDLSGVYSLLHEVGHALLGHKRYHLDFELLSLEVAAWEEARSVAGRYGITIDEDHIQDCLDSYRDWLYRRSICPTCSTKALQSDDGTGYHCFNCHTDWRVAPSRFCRPYRQTKGRSRQGPAPIFGTQAL